MLSNDKTKFERVKDMPKLKAEIVRYLFDFISRKPRDQWWHYKGEFKYDGHDYDLECDCRYDNVMFTYRNLHISHKQVVIDVEDVLNMDLSEMARKH